MKIENYLTFAIKFFSSAIFYWTKKRKGIVKGAGLWSTNKEPILYLFRRLSFQSSYFYRCVLF